MGPDWAAVLVAIGSFVIAGVAAILSSRAAGYAKGQSEATERQAIAAEASVEVMRRQVEIMERQLVAQEVSSRTTEVAGSDPGVERSSVLAALRAEMRGAPYVPPWSVIAVSKNAYALVNGGTEVAHDVHISFDVKPPRAEPTAWTKVDPRSQARFMVLRAFGASPTTVTVRWRREPDGEPMEWTTALL